MRGLLASSIGVACAAALALPLTLPASGARAVTPGTPPAAGPAAEATPGSTQSLPLGPLGSDRSLDPSGASEQGLARRDVRPFSLVGVVWNDPEADLHGSVQVRTRAIGTATWTGWRHVETHNHEHAADPGTAERGSSAVRGSTAPLWVGDSDGIEIRVRADGTASAGPNDTVLPEGLRLELVDPGEEPPPESPTDATDSTDADSTDATDSTDSAGPDELAEAPRATAPAGATVGQVRPRVGPRPRIVTRKGWGANERLRERKFAYSKTVKAAFVHHSASGNYYRCSQAGALLRSIYRYHVKSSGWRDLGYNFAVDKCGNIYEGRAGGVAKPVLGAHTLGFNSNTMGIAVLGTYSRTTPPKAAVKAIAKLSAWKLGLYGANPRGTTVLKSGGGNLYKKGRNVRLRVISGHRDGFATECPGSRLYKKLGKARSAAARYQGR
ncbi:peptidoglycan recognition protein [Streptomyces sp. NPDC093510]|uniref:peptidoglycan recognition protein family protein n=1 Tax=Streptomyces sp. NPDC093510 TaxID=3155199 RepID=UPI00342DAA1F